MASDFPRRLTFMAKVQKAPFWAVKEIIAAAEKVHLKRGPCPITKANGSEQNQVHSDHPPELRVKKFPACPKFR